MNKKTGSYVGITGFMSLAEVVHCNGVFCRAKAGTHWMLRKDSGLKFMAGILVSSKTLAGGTNKYPNRYPSIRHVPEILSFDQPHLLRTIHYNTDDVSTIDDQVDQVMAIAPAEQSMPSSSMSAGPIRSGSSASNVNIPVFGSSCKSAQVPSGM